jgi:hypothetical protein
VVCTILIRAIFASSESHCYILIRDRGAAANAGGEFRPAPASLRASCGSSRLQARAPPGPVAGACRDPRCVGAINFLRTRIIALRGWSAYRDQIGFVPDPMNLRAGGSGRCAVNSDARSSAIGDRLLWRERRGRRHRPDKRLIAIERTHVTASRLLLQ